MDALQFGLLFDIDREHATVVAYPHNYAISYQPFWEWVYHTIDNQ